MIADISLGEAKSQDNRIKAVAAIQHYGSEWKIVHDLTYSAFLYIPLSIISH